MTWDNMTSHKAHIDTNNLKIKVCEQKAIMMTIQVCINTKASLKSLHSIVHFNKSTYIAYVIWEVCNVNSDTPDRPRSESHTVAQHTSLCNGKYMLCRQCNSR